MYKQLGTRLRGHDMLRVEILVHEKTPAGVLIGNHRLAF
jgi:hypothetical protein